MIGFNPITYYGCKQSILSIILPMMPEHNLYCEPFFSGGAVFSAKEPSKIEVINDTNREEVNFYRVVQNDFVSLEKEIKISLHSRDLHRKAKVIYDNPDMFGNGRVSEGDIFLLSAVFFDLFKVNQCFDS